MKVEICAYCNKEMDGNKQSWGAVLRRGKVFCSYFCSEDAYSVKDPLGWETSDPLDYPWKFRSGLVVLTPTGPVAAYMDTKHGVLEYQDSRAHLWGEDYRWLWQKALVDSWPEGDPRYLDEPPEGKLLIVDGWDWDLRADSARINFDTWELVMGDGRRYAMEDYQDVTWMEYPE